MLTSHNNKRSQKVVSLSRHATVLHLLRPKYLVSLPVWQLVWLTKMTSSLSSRESGEELESVSMPSESLLLSSLMLITPPLSTVCLGTLVWRPRGFPDMSEATT